jgi:SAM-dependent methyltransferase
VIYNPLGSAMREFKPAKPEIQYIILDTAKHMVELRKQLDLVRDTFDDEEYVLQTVIQELMFEKNAQIDLAYCCLETVQHCLGEVYEAEAQIVASAINKFGEEIFRQLRDIRAYHNGYLFYQYMRILGNDIMLIRTEPPKIYR